MTLGRSTHGRTTRMPIAASTGLAIHRIEWRRKSHRPGIPARRHTVHKRVCVRFPQPRRAVPAAQAAPGRRLTPGRGQQPPASRRPRDPSASEGLASPTNPPPVDSSPKQARRPRRQRRGRSRRHRPAQRNHPPQQRTTSSTSSTASASSCSGCTAFPHASSTSASRISSALRRATRSGSQPS